MSLEVVLGVLWLIACLTVLTLRGQDQPVLPTQLQDQTAADEVIANVGPIGTSAPQLPAYQLASLDGGDITVRSRAGHGSVFTFSLPLVAAPARTGGVERLVGQHLRQACGSRRARRRHRATVAPATA